MTWSESPPSSTSTSSALMPPDAERYADCARANPNPGPSVFHDFDCTHDPCRCPARDADYVLAACWEGCGWNGEVRLNDRGLWSCPQCARLQPWSDHSDGLEAPNVEP